jgi:electron transfer flavoprotein alpha/beta subunit
LLKLLVCFKTAYDLDEVTAEEWNQCLRDGQNPAFMRKTLGIYDESALELALRLKDDAELLGGEAELTALTITDDLPDLTAKNLFAARYSHVALVMCEQDLRFRPDIVADIVCGYVQNSGSFDFIITGQQANVGNNGQTHLLIAESLGLPCALNVTDAFYDANGLRVTSLVDDGILEQTITNRAVLGVGNALHPFLRVATLRDRMNASQKSVDTILAKTLIPGGESRLKLKTTLLSLTRQKNQRDCLFIKGDTVREKARALYDACLIEATRS